MAHKMTIKEFKEGLKVAGLEDHGLKHILDIVCVHLQTRARESREKGYEASYRAYLSDADALYDYLDEWEKKYEPLSEQDLIDLRNA